MVKGMTTTGFKFSVDPDAIKDMEFIELAAEADENGLAFPKLLVKLLGEKQKQALYDHVRNKKGRVMAEDVSKEITEIFDALKENSETKNS